MVQFDASPFMQRAQMSQQSFNRVGDTFAQLMQQQKAQEQADLNAKVARAQQQEDVRGERAFKERMAGAKSEAAMQSDPAFILSEMRQGKPVTPQQKAIVDIAAAKSQRAGFDPVTGQMVQTGGFPEYGQQQVPQPVERPPMDGQDPFAVTPKIGLDPEVAAWVSSAPNPREKAERMKIANKEMMATRAEKRETAKEVDKELTQSATAVRTIDSILNEDLSDVTGFFLGRQSGVAPVTSAQRRIQPKIDQLKGQAFLQAYQGLKGGGQITEVEGKKAEQAQVAMSQTQDEGDFRKALTDYKKIIENGMARKRGEEPPHTFEEAKQAVSPNIQKALDAGYTMEQIQERMRGR